MRRDSRVDGNQKQIVDFLRACGVTIQHLHFVGGGCPDLLCGFRGETELIEIKTEKGRLTGDQERWMQRWNGRPVRVVRSIKEAMHVFGIGESDMNPDDLYLED